MNPQLASLNETRGTTVEVSEEEPLFRFPSSSSFNERPLFGDGSRNRDRLITIGLVSACGLLIGVTIITLIFTKFTFVNLMALFCIISTAGSHATLIYWYRLGDLDPKFRNLLFWNSQKMSLDASHASTSSTRSNKASTHPLHLYKESGNLIPVVYKPEYNISFWNIESIHPFDSKKWGRIASLLMKYFEHRGLQIEFACPDHPITNAELSLVHTKTFICKINCCKLAVIRATEVPLLCCVPMCIIRRKLLTPLKWQTSGSILAGYLALKHGYGINLGGGFHHCYSSTPGGFCLFADITLTIRYLWQEVNEHLKVLIVDLDAHQGNGHERDVLDMPKVESERVYIFDMFNANIYPGDHTAKSAISRMVELGNLTEDDKYLKLLKFHMKESLTDFSPDLIIYNAGTDILEGDPLGYLSITPKGVQMRDEIVFSAAVEKHIPILMLTSGGYQSNNAQVIANSLINLYEKGIINARL